MKRGRDVPDTLMLRCRSRYIAIFRCTAIGTLELTGQTSTVSSSEFRGTRNLYRERHQQKKDPFFNESFDYSNFICLEFKCFHELGSEITSSELRIIHQFLVEWDSCFHTFDDVFIQCTFHFQDCFFTRLCHYDQFPDH